MASPEEGKKMSLKEKIAEKGVQPEDFLWVLEEGPEVTLFLTIEAIGNYIGNTSRRIIKGEIAETDELKKRIIYSRINLYWAVQQTVRFGVQEPVVNNHLSDEFTLWWKWWHDYVEGLSTRHWRKGLSWEVERKWDVSIVSRWRPEGDWRKATIPSLSLPT